MGHLNNSVLAAYLNGAFAQYLPIRGAYAQCLLIRGVCAHFLLIRGARAQFLLIRGACAQCPLIHADCCQLNGAPAIQKALVTWNWTAALPLTRLSMVPPRSSFRLSAQAGHGYLQ